MSKESTHVPSFLWFPSILPRGKKISGLASTMDLLPTIFDVFGISLAGRLDGESLIPELYEGRMKERILGVSPLNKETYILKEKEEWRSAKDVQQK